ncbi:polyhydroxybutyrate depolymerase [Methylocystis echinoides]|uniref:extracellular catalytic domain type 2 short-chain-length polyhydroxyalkanoate depolymerase n=1 Tax=Methylocystis echinoides TaxID=29468 RepID=UPI00342B91E8
MFGDKIFRSAIIAPVLACGGSGPAFAADPLPAYGASISETSVSGISSGAAMAVQFHVAHSSTVKGAGVIAGVPYGCAENSATRATRNCMKPDADHPAPDLAHLKAMTDGLVRSRAVDDVANLNSSRVWLFSGRADKVVLTPVMDVVRDYYALYLPTAEQIVYRKDVDAGHAMITEDYGDACDVTGEPFIDDCNLDAAGAILAQIYGKLNPRNAQESGRYIQFDQKEFLPDGDARGHSLSDAGYAYVPTACAEESCRVHVAFHGCRQQVDAIGDRFYKHAGYNRWADTNHIIVLYPQTISRWGWGWPFYTFNFRWNPNACWDWWGYDGGEYHTKSGTQIQAIWGMVARLAGKANR